MPTSRDQKIPNPAGQIRTDYVFHYRIDGKTNDYTNRILLSHISIGKEEKFKKKEK